MAKKEAGGKSAQQNDFLEPLAPINVVATDVGTSRPFDNGAASVSFELPAGSPPATSFTASGFCSRHNTFHTAMGSASPLVVQGFGSNIGVVFTVTATNMSGTSAASSESSSITITTVPATMSPPTASAGVNQDVVSWTAPASGGKAISLYRWTSSDGKTGTTASTSVTVAQEGGTAQTYQVRAENANGNGIYSAASNSVTTASPFFPFFPYFPYFPFFPGFGPSFWYYSSARFKNSIARIVSISSKTNK
jgi:hypothetical protein